MKMYWQVWFDDLSKKQLFLEKPSGEHPDSRITIACVFLEADAIEKKIAVGLQRCATNGLAFGDYISRKQAAEMILDEIERRKNHHEQSATNGKPDHS